LNPVTHLIPSQLVIRANANPRVGAGHVLRCLSLAQAWQSEGRTAWINGIKIIGFISPKGDVD
tara:strand:- start:643 stop:831 length:189 start_codon:yes stop_codon:yes gene_type:complete